MDSILVAVLVGVGLAGVVLGIGVVLLRRAGARRRVAGDRRTAELVATAETRAGQALVRTDDRVRQAGDELSFAIAQFGEAATGDYAAAIRRARDRLAEAFRLRQRLDDAEPDTPAQRTEWSERIVELCASADAALDEQAAAFARLRADEQRVPDSVQRVRARLGEGRAQQSAAAAALERVTAGASPAVAAELGLHVEQGARLLAVVERSLELAQRRSADGRVADAVALLETADESLDRAATLFGAVDRYETDAIGAESAFAALRLETVEELAEAEALAAAAATPQRRAPLERAIMDARAALDELPPDAVAGDPRAALTRLRAANTTLDEAVAGTRDHAEQQRVARSRLEAALDDADRQLASAHELVGGYRGPVGPDARTRLAEAERLLADITDERDAAVALDRARRSANLASHAAALARRDLEYAQQGSQGGRGAGAAAGVVGGLVVGGLLGRLGDLDDLGDLFD